MLEQDTERFKSELQAVRSTFLMTAYACRMAIHIEKPSSYPHEAYPEVYGAAYALDQTFQKLAKPERQKPLFEEICYQSSVAGLLTLRERGIKNLATFESLEPEEKFPLELKREVELQPTAWGGLRRNNDLPRIQALVSTADTLSNKRVYLPSFPSLLNLGHFSCAIVNATGELLQKNKWSK